MFKVGCAGFPVGRDRYWRAFDFVEAKTGEAMPRAETLAGWRSGAPADAEFAVQAHRFITYGPEDRGFPPAGKRLTPLRRRHCGAFRDSLEVYEAWQATRAAAEALKARIIVFETPESFDPGPDRLRDFYRFFRALPKARWSPVWSPRGAAWAPTLADRVCGELGLIRAFDPLRERAPGRGAFLYMRPRAPRVGNLSVDNMSTIRSAAAGRPAYAVLTHRLAFADAERLAQPEAPPRRPR
jgi:uncharacterized protein YecE (DUF72 family)